MKDIVEFLNHKNIICKRLKEIKPKELSSRKKITIYVGVDLHGYFCSIFEIEKKSRILQKEATEIMQLQHSLEGLEDTKILKKYLLIQTQICSKAKTILEAAGWILWHYDNQNQG